MGSPQRYFNLGNGDSATPRGNSLGQIRLGCDTDIAEAVLASDGIERNRNVFSLLLKARTFCLQLSEEELASGSMLCVRRRQTADRLKKGNVAMMPSLIGICCDCGIQASRQQPPERSQKEIL